MEVVLNLNQIGLVVSVIAGILGLAATLYKICTRPLKKYEENIKDLDAKIMNNTVRLGHQGNYIQELQKDIENIHHSMDIFSQWISTEAMTISDILNHEIDGNHIDKLRVLRQNYHSFLTNAKMHWK